MTGLVSCLFILAQTFITLDQALEIALSENVAVKVAPDFGEDSPNLSFDS